MDLPCRACSTLCALPPPLLRIFIFVSLSARIYLPDAVIWTFVLVEWRQVQLEFPLVIGRIAGRPRILIKAPNGRCTVGPPFGFMSLPCSIASSTKKIGNTSCFTSQIPSILPSQSACTLLDKSNLELFSEMPPCLDRSLCRKMCHILVRKDLKQKKKQDHVLILHGNNS